MITNEELRLHLEDEMKSVPASPARLDESTRSGSRQRRRTWVMSAAAAIVMVIGLGVVVPAVTGGSGGRFGAGEAPRPRDTIEFGPDYTVEVTGWLGDFDGREGVVELWQGKEPPVIEGDFVVGATSRQLVQGEPINPGALNASPAVYLGNLDDSSLYVHAGPGGLWNRLLNVFGGAGATCLSTVDADGIRSGGTCFNAGNARWSVFNGEGNHVVVVVGLDREAAMGIITTDDGSAFWQQPVSGTIWLEFDGTTPQTLTVLDRFGAELWTDTLGLPSAPGVISTTTGPVTGTTP